MTIYYQIAYIGKYTEMFKNNQMEILALKV